MATRGLQRLVRGLLRMPLRLQPGPCLVAWRQGEVEPLAATADGGRQARGIGHDQPQVAPGLRLFQRLEDGVPGVVVDRVRGLDDGDRSEEHTSELQSLMRISYAVFCFKKKT